MHSRIFHFIFVAVMFPALFTAGCSAQVSEQQSLTDLREMTAGGKLPAESVVKNIADRFHNTRTGVLALLLLSRIRFEHGDFKGAAQILSADTFEKYTDLADYALWLRGRSLQSGGDHASAMAAFEKLVNKYPRSLRADPARLLWADSALASDHAAEIPAFLKPLVDSGSAAAMLASAKAFEAAGKQADAITDYRKAYIYGGNSQPGKNAEAKLTALGQSLDPQNAEELRVRADRLLAAGSAVSAYDLYSKLLQTYPNVSADADVHLNRLKSAVAAKDAVRARAAFDAMPMSMDGKDNAYADLIKVTAAAGSWPQTHALADEMRTKFPKSPLIVKAWVDAGMAADNLKSQTEETYFLNKALDAFPDAVEVAGAQFGLAWIEHTKGNFARSSEMLTEHLARYADKDTSNRGKAGYWSARDSERAGKTPAACELYEATAYRYGANWYGHLALERLGSLVSRGLCKGSGNSAGDATVAKAAANLRIVTVAPERAGPYELKRAEKADQLSTIGLFDWAIDELAEAAKTAENSPSINLALARHYRLKGDNVNALLSLAKSYPDYSQMFPEEMGREEWDIFYPLTNWGLITTWAKNRGLDKYQVAGLIRQETIFDANAHSGANAYGLMQLLLPTARLIARKTGSSANLSSAESLYDPAINIELGTAYMRDQLDKFGRIEYMAVAYNAGPNRVPQWRAALPAEMDEFVEAIPFRETRGYVQGVIRNSEQYRRLYDDNGQFKANVGTKPIRAAIDSMPSDRFAAEFPEVVVKGRKTAE